MVQLFILGVILLGLGALLGPWFRRKPILGLYVVHSAAALGSAAWLAFACFILKYRVFHWSVPGPLPFLQWSFRVDGLSAFFLAIVAFVALMASGFAPGYLKSYTQNKNLWALNSCFNLFILSMGFVVAAGDAWTFLFAWEAMAVVSFFLVLFEHHEKKNRQAAYIYLIMTHIGTAFVLALFLCLQRFTGTLDFLGMHMAASRIPTALRGLLFLLALVGFGTKAGIVPLHIWLPKAHPAAPGHISALMSGVMLKTAVYALIRIVFGVLGGGPSWWGLLLIGVGLTTALVGVLYALMEQNMKRLLAYSSVENIGIILLGVGAALYLKSAGLPRLCLFALGAALIHSANHALFKSLLFFGVGAVQQQTHTRNLEKLGGLIRRMPWTALFFLVGSLAISAMPFTNGFIGEWRVLQSLLLMGKVQADPIMMLSGPVAAAGLALTGGLAAACFVKAFGVAFLALPRSTAAAEAREVNPGMLGAMGIPAVLCLALGIVPGLINMAINPVCKALDLGTSSVGIGRLSGGHAFGNGSPIAILAIFALVALIGWTAMASLGKNRIRKAPTWACGVTLQPQMEYTGISFSQPLRRIFSVFLRPRREVKTQHAGSRYFLTRITFRSVIPSLIEERLYQPAGRLFVGIANGVRRLQNGSLQSYLAYLLLTLIILLILNGGMH